MVKKDQHHVPKFMLRKWISQGNKGLKVYSKKRKEWIAKGKPVVNPEDICFKKDLYEHDMLPVNTIENGYSVLEDILSKAYNKICEEKVKLNDLSRFEQICVGYIPVMLTTRQPNVVKAIDDASDIIKMEFPDLYKLFPDDDTLIAFGRAVVSGVVMEPSIMKMYLGFLRTYYKQIWGTERVLWKCVRTSGKGLFFETDQGFASVRLDKYDPYSIILFTPITPKKCIIVFSAKYGRYVITPKNTINDALVRIINEALFDQAIEHVIYPC